MPSQFFIPDPEGQTPSPEGYFGAFGGKFIPEALVAAVDEVAVEYDKAKHDPEFARELDDLLVNYTGRPSALTEVPRFAAEAGGARIFLKREDLNHTGSHKINNVLGQALLTKRMGKTRVIAETGAYQHGVATATACALFGLECTIYMGEIDTQRQALNVARMRMLGAEVIAVKSGSRTLKDAINEAFRDWVANVDHTHYLFGTVGGPHPFPAMVRDFHRVIGVETRRQLLERAGRLPDAAVACVGGGSNAIGLFHAFIPDTDVRLIGCEPHGPRRRDRRARGHPDRRMSPASCTAPARTSSRTTRARSPSRTRSRPVWTTRASAPSTPTSRTPAVASTARSRTTRPCRPCACCPVPRASSRPSRAPTRWASALEVGKELGKDGLIVVNLSGRGDKDMDTAARYFGLYDTDAEVAADADTDTAEIEGDAK